MPHHFTPEMRRRAVEARRLKIATNPYRKDWMDSDIWDSLARNRRIRLPAWHRAPTSPALLKWHRKLRTEPFSEVYGCSPSRLISMNPKTPLRAFLGQMLETAQ